MILGSSLQFPEAEQKDSDGCCEHDGRHIKPSWAGETKSLVNPSADGKTNDNSNDSSNVQAARSERVCHSFVSVVVARDWAALNLFAV
jgi:hypothetical protein